MSSMTAVCGRVAVCITPLLCVTNSSVLHLLISYHGNTPQSVRLWLRHELFSVLEQKNKQNIWNIWLYFA